MTTENHHVTDLSLHGLYSAWFVLADDLDAQAANHLTSITDAAICRKLAGIELRER